MELSKLLTLAFVATVACGDNVVPRCLHDNRFAGPPDICGPARAFAARDSTTLVPAQEDVDRYAERWQLAIGAEPILGGRTPQRYLSGTVFTSNPAVIAAWTSGTVHSGDAQFDALISEVGVASIDAFWIKERDDLYYFLPHITSIFSEPLWIQRLAATDSWPWPPDSASPWPPSERPQDNGTWQWIDDGLAGATAQIDFRFGWGDCTVACQGFHAVRAIVPPGGPATVYDAGGDVLPPWLHLSPATVPLN